MKSFQGWINDWISAAGLIWCVWPLTLQTDEVFLEAQIQNITTSPMFMEKVSLEPSMMYNVTELNNVSASDER